MPAGRPGTRPAAGALGAPSPGRRGAGWSGGSAGWGSRRALRAGPFLNKQRRIIENIKSIGHLQNAYGFGFYADTVGWGRRAVRRSPGAAAGNRAGRAGLGFCSSGRTPRGSLNLSWPRSAPWKLENLIIDAVVRAT